MAPARTAVVAVEMIAPGQRKACDGCGAMIVGAVTKDGKCAPITMEPKANGNVLVFRAPIRGEDAIQCRTFAGFALQELLEQGVPLRLNHFADCPKAEQFR